MPTYRVTDPDTGRVLRLTGDSPPTTAEITKAFLDAANATPLSEPTTYGEGAWQGFQEGALGGATGFAKGVARSPIDLATGLKDLVTSPLETIRGTGAGILNLVKAVPGVVGAMAGGAMTPEAGAIAQDPQAFGQAIGSHVGQLALTAKPSLVPRAVGAVGRGMQAVGRLPAVSRASTYGAIGAGMGGHMLAAAATAAVPATIRGTGRILSQGTRVAEALDRGQAALGSRMGQALQRAHIPPRSGAAGEGAVQAGAPHPRATSAATTSTSATSGSLDEAMHRAIQAHGGQTPAAAPAQPQVAPPAAPQVFPRILSWKEGRGPSAQAAQQYRQQFGSREAARRLKTTPGHIKDLAPGESQLPAAAREAIDARISGLAPEEGTPYLKAAPNDLAASYIEEQLRRALDARIHTPPAPTRVP